MRAKSVWGLWRAQFELTLNKLQIESINWFEPSAQLLTLLLQPVYSFLVKWLSHACRLGLHYYYYHSLSTLMRHVKGPNPWQDNALSYIIPSSSSSSHNRWIDDHLKAHGKVTDVMRYNLVESSSPHKNISTKSTTFVNHSFLLCIPFQNMLIVDSVALLLGK